MTSDMLVDLIDIHLCQMKLMCRDINAESDAIMAGAIDLLDAFGR